MTANGKLYVGRPNIGDRAALLARINGMLDRRWLSNDGPLTREFEGRIAKLLGVKHAVALCNATVGLEIASRALGLSGEVIVPSFTFIATAHALHWQGIKPVFCDIDPATHNLDPARIEELITPETTGIVGVHVWGRPCETEAIESVARRHGLKVMYDASHAFGCSSGGRMIGGFGSCEVFSFHATKFINCFEGGAVTTDDDELAGKLRLMRNFGFKGFDNVIYPGVNGKMARCAQRWAHQSQAMDEIIAANRRNYFAYREQLADLPGLSWSVMTITRRTISNMSSFRLISARGATSLKRLGKCDRPEYFWPGCHRMEPYLTAQPGAAKKLPETERIAARVIVLPTGQTVDEGAVHRVCGIIRKVIAR